MIKPLQAVGLVASGAVEAFQLPLELVALGASSQFGEPIHIRLLQTWCKAIGVEPSDIRCGTHKPFNPGAAEALVREGSALTAFHNNNCGKHLSYLTIARHLKCSISDYLDYQHPVQAYLRSLVRCFIPPYGNSEDYVLEDCDAPGHSGCSFSPRASHGPREIKEMKRTRPLTSNDRRRSQPHVGAG
jgi:L-asparaginase II